MRYLQQYSVKGGRVTPAEYLQSQPPVDSKPNNTLLIPSTYGYGMYHSQGCNVALADRFGYALQVGSYLGSLAFLSDPNDPRTQSINLAAARPDRYSLKVLLFPNWIDYDSRYKLRDDGGNIINQADPLASDTLRDEATDTICNPVQTVAGLAPISVVQNGGEYQVLLAKHKASFALNSAVVAAKGSMSWYEFCSRRKAHYENHIANRVRQVVPDRQVYCNYTVGSPLYQATGGVDWSDYEYDYTYTKPSTDYPSYSSYYNQFNTGYTGTNANGRPIDILTLQLYGTAKNMAGGEPYSYTWVSGGWNDPDNGFAYSDLGLYRGWLVSLYMSGNLGSIGSYFTADSLDDTPFDHDNPPHWIMQLTILARIHATFTWFDDFIYQSDLLPGDHAHANASYLPSCEYNAYKDEGVVAVQLSGVRVLARKHRSRDEWLVSAWSTSGVTKDCYINLPLYGRLRLQATRGAKLYHVTALGGAVIDVPVQGDSDIAVTPYIPPRP